MITPDDVAKVLGLAARTLGPNTDLRAAKAARDEAVHAMGRAWQAREPKEVQDALEAEWRRLNGVYFDIKDRLRKAPTAQ